MNKIKVTFPGNREVLVDYKSQIGDIVKDMETKENLSEIFAFKINNEIKTYSANLYEDCKVEYIKYQSEEGYRIYLRSLKFVLYLALRRIDKDIKLSIPHSIYGSYFCKLEDIEITDELIDRIKTEMRNIINEDLLFERRVLPAKETEILYKKNGELDKAQMMEDKLRNYSTVYFCEDEYNYFYGALVPRSSMLKAFDVSKYMHGFVLTMPKMGEINTVSEFKESKKIFETFEEYEKLSENLGVPDIASLNRAVRDNRISDVIQINDAIQDRKIVEMALDIKRRPEVKLVLIAGPSSSAKTTTAQKLAIQLRLNGQIPVVISMDNYFVEREDSPRDENGNYDFESIEALDLKLFNDHINKLIAGEKIEMPEFDFLTGHKKYNGKFIQLAEDSIIIIEGIHGLNEKMTELVPRDKKYKIFVSALTTLNIDRYTRVSTLDTRLIRRIIRDSQFRGHKAERTLAMWNSVRKGEEKNIFPFQEEADFVYNSSMTYEMGVFKTFAQPLLMQVEDTSEYYSEARRLYEFLNNFLAIDTANIPIDSTIREFIGGGCFYR